MIEEGARVPRFGGMTSGGQRVGSDTLKGRRYVVYFYPRDFTPGCTTEAGEFTAEYKRFKKAGIEVVGVSPDDADSHGRFCEKMGIPYPLLADTDHRIASAFGAWGRKKFMGKEYDGVIRSTFLVDEKGTVFRVFPKVKPAGHAKQVLEEFG
ncbi:MAG: thioredoxin-dependent thiol peroxidase [Nitrosopumilus sp.]|nr:thioredoxin-dependent thiol peroxidase [Nitrosopumilus sp.]MDA7958459.1 thioredoxin-dependent thiol peroxidase [Nitrosopumilus sp.]MDA7959055.1 thioredoxin-dependent thiol peroxidase [Nitrosopumilus sp.]MDA7959232.1 thioredoxin-dependent thiol peroxidase [Nitrosopumilus sp.]